VVFARHFGDDYLGALEKLHLKLSGKYFFPWLLHSKSVIC
jgi:hypothetical protein